MNHLGLFAKYWQPGRVKTRLAATIGAKTACQLYRNFVFHLLDRLESVADGRTIVFSPRDQEQDFRDQIQQNWEFEPQSAGDLGVRMQTFFENRFDCVPPNQRPHKIIVIGADCPQLSPQEIAIAFEELDQHDVVIGPCSDGGYYLLGMKNDVVDVFSDVQWSTDAVLPATTQRLNDLGKSYSLLRERTDVDDIDALRLLMDELQSLPEHADLLGRIEQLLAEGSTP